MGRTIYDIAQEANVSPATVSRVLNNKGYVSSETRARVLNAAQGFTLHSRSSAPPVRIISKTIGLIVAHDSSYFFMNNTYLNIMQGISEVAKQHDYTLLLEIGGSVSAEIELYSKGKVDGFILLGIKKSSVLIQELLRLNIPFVLIGDYISEYAIGSFCKVDIDDFSAAREATDYLLTLGHKRIAFISGSFEYASCYNRYLGYKSALKDAGLCCEDKYVVSSSNMTEENAANLTKKMLYQADLPTAIIAFNDIISVAVYKAVKDCGYSIPQDISVIGFDDSLFAKYVTPALTTVWQPSIEKGETAATILIEGLIHPPISKKNVTLASALIYRDSCSFPKGDRSDRSLSQ